MAPGLPPRQPRPGRSRPDRLPQPRPLRDRSALHPQRPRPQRLRPRRFRLLLRPRPPQHSPGPRRQRLPQLRQHRHPLLLRRLLLPPRRQPLHRRRSHRQQLLCLPLLPPASSPVPVRHQLRPPRPRPVLPLQAGQVAPARVRATTRSLPRKACPARVAPTAVKANVRHDPVRLARARAITRSLRRRVCPEPEPPVLLKQARAVLVPQPAPVDLVLQQVQVVPVRALRVPAEPARLRE